MHRLLAIGELFELLALLSLPPARLTRTAAKLPHTLVRGPLAGRSIVVRSAVHDDRLDVEDDGRNCRSTAQPSAFREKHDFSRAQLERDRSWEMNASSRFAKKPTSIHWQRPRAFGVP